MTLRAEDLDGLYFWRNRKTGTVHVTAQPYDGETMCGLSRRPFGNRLVHAWQSQVLDRPERLCRNCARELGIEL